MVAYSSPGFITYSFEELKTGMCTYIHTYILTYSKSLINDVVIGASLPVDVDPSQRELYLENETFKKLFGMDKVR